MIEEAVVFRCGEEELVGVVHRAAHPGGNCGVLVIVGGPQYRAGSHRQFTLMARSMASHGIPVLRFDCRGMGDSDGRSHGFEGTRSDIAAGIGAFFATVPSVKKVVLLGLCDAASAILMHGCGDPRVGGVILSNPWVQSASGEAGSYLRHYYVRRVLQRSFWVKLLKLRVNLRSSLDDWLRILRTSRRDDLPVPFVRQMLAGLSAFAGPVLVLLSEHDLVARQFSDLCRVDDQWRQAVGRQFVSVHHLISADHTFSSRVALDAATSACLEWLSRSDTRLCH